MSLEGTFVFNLSAILSNGGTFTARQRNTTDQFDIAGKYAVHRIFTIGTADTVLDIENIPTPGYIFFFNTDAVNQANFGADGTQYPVGAPPRRFGVTPWNGAAIHGKAPAAPVDVEMLILPK